MDHTLTTADGTLHLRDDGQGTPVIFVHGTPSASHEFRGVFHQLAGHARCIAFDHLGFGRSDKPAHADYSISAHQQRFAEAMQQLDTEPAIFVLHDFGTAFALPWMLDNPSRVRGVVLMNTFLWAAEGPVAWLLRFYATALGRWIYRVSNLSARWLLPWVWGKHKPLDTETHALYLAPFQRAGDRYATAALPGELLGSTITAMASKVSALAQWPVAAVWGMADPMIGPDALDRWKAALPEMTVVEVEQAGHFVADEAPDAVAGAVQGLLQQTSGKVRRIRSR